MIQAIYLEKVSLNCVACATAPYPRQVVKLDLNKHLDHTYDRFTFKSGQYQFIDAIGIDFIPTYQAPADIHSIIKRVGGICIIGNTGGPWPFGPCPTDPTLLVDEVNTGFNGAN